MDDPPQEPEFSAKDFFDSVQTRKPAADSTTPEGLLQKVQSHDDDDPLFAIRFLEQLALKMHPGDTGLLSDLGRLYAQIARSGSAERTSKWQYNICRAFEYFADVHKIKPDYTPILIEAARLARENGDF